MGRSGKTFGQRLRELRHARGLTLEELAARVIKSGGRPITQAYLSQIENGVRPAPREHLLIQLERALGLSSGSLREARLGRINTPIADRPLQVRMSSLQTFKRKYPWMKDLTAWARKTSDAVRADGAPPGFKLKVIIDQNGQIEHISIVEEVG